MVEVVESALAGKFMRAVVATANSPVAPTEVRAVAARPRGGWAGGVEPSRVAPGELATVEWCGKRQPGSSASRSGSSAARRASRVYGGSPAPTNLVVPRYSFESTGRLLIGRDSEGVQDESHAQAAWRMARIDCRSQGDEIHIVATAQPGAVEKAKSA